MKTFLLFLLILLPHTSLANSFARAYVLARTLHLQRSSPFAAAALESSQIGQLGRYVSALKDPLKRVGGLNSFDDEAVFLGSTVVPDSPLETILDDAFIEELVLLSQQVEAVHRNGAELVRAGYRTFRTRRAFRRLSEAMARTGGEDLSQNWLQPRLISRQLRTNLEEWLLDHRYALPDAMPNFQPDRGTLFAHYLGYRAELPGRFRWELDWFMRWLRDVDARLEPRFVIPEGGFKPYPKELQSPHRSLDRLLRSEDYAVLRHVRENLARLFEGQRALTVPAGDSGKKFFKLVKPYRIPPRENYLLYLFVEGDSVYIALDIEAGIAFPAVVKAELKEAIYRTQSMLQNFHFGSREFRFNPDGREQLLRPRAGLEPEISSHHAVLGPLKTDDLAWVIFLENLDQSFETVARF